MSNSIGEASLQLTADASALNQELADSLLKIGAFVSKAEKEVRKVDSSFSKMGKGALAGGVAGAATGFVASVGGQVASTIRGAFSEAADRLKEIGLTKERAAFFGMRPDEYSVLESGITAVGGNAKEFMESLGSIQTAIANARNGTPEATRAFAELGITVERFGKLGGFQQVMTVFDKLKAYDGNKFGVGGVLLGTDGVKNMVPALNMGAEAFVALGRQTALSTDQILAAKVAADELAKANASLSSAYDKTLIAMTPLFTYVGSTLPELLKGMDFESAGRQVTDAFLDVADGMEGLVESARPIMAELRSMGSTPGGRWVRGLNKSIDGNVQYGLNNFSAWARATSGTMTPGFEKQNDAAMAAASKLLLDGSDLMDGVEPISLGPDTATSRVGQWRAKVERQRVEREAKLKAEAEADARRREAALNKPTLDTGLNTAVESGIAGALAGITAAKESAEQTREIAKAEKQAAKLELKAVAQSLAAGTPGANEVIARFENMQTEAKLALQIERDQLQAQREIARHVARPPLLLGSF